MPWKDESKADRPPGPWDGSAASPPKLGPRPWDETPQDEADAPKRRRTPSLRPPSVKATGAARAPRKAAKTPARSGRRSDKTTGKAAASRRPDLVALKHRLSHAASTRLTAMRGRRTWRVLAAGAGLGVLCGWAIGGVYRVGPDQTGVVERFGAFLGQTGPGVHYHLPWPIGRVQIVTVGLTAPDAGRPDDLDGSERMLAAEGEPVQITYGVTWRVDDPQRYLFHVADAPALLRRLSDGAIRRAVGGASLTALLDSDRASIEDAAARDLQRALDRLGAGVQVSAVELRGVDPAAPAQGAARDLAAAREDVTGEAADAAAYRDRVVAAARGEAAKALEDARGAADQEVAEARGEADRFTALDAAYRQAPEATRERLYTETMERVLKATNKIVVDTPKGSTLVLPSSVASPHGPDAVAPPPAAPAPQTAVPSTGAPT